MTLPSTIQKIGCRLKTNLNSPFIMAVATVWMAWIVINFTQRMYYADNPEQVVYTWMKIRFLQGFNGMWATLLLFAIYRQFFKKELPLVYKVAWVALLTYAFSLALVLINMSVYRYFFEKTPLILTWQRYLVVAFSKFFIILGLSIFYFLIVHWQALQQQREKTLKAVALANEAQLQMLRYQLNPHFLFNALNSIRTLVYEDPRKADRIITDLSDFLRHTLTNENDHAVKLSDELEIIKNYLAIQKIRFEDRLVVGMDISPEALAFKVPCFLIHPLVENAIKYGLQSSPPPLRIDISATFDGNTFETKVRNTGKLNGQHQLSGCGKGLNNIRMRLNHFFPNRNSLALFEDAGYVHAIINIEAIGNEG